VVREAALLRVVSFFLFFQVNPRAFFQLGPVLPMIPRRRMLAVPELMKMLFFSADGSEVEHVSREFTQAGIPCEIHKQNGASARTRSRDSELWIQNDRDCHRALMLCVQLGIGFARRRTEEPDPNFELEFAIPPKSMR